MRFFSVRFRKVKRCLPVECAMKQSSNCDSHFARHKGHEVRLMQERFELQKAINSTETQLKHLLDEVAKENFSGLTSEEQILVHRSSLYRERLKRVQQGLQRIRDGTFGICVSCEGPIGNRRLRALPSASYCIDCQECFEQGLAAQKLTGYLRSSKVRVSP
jgi:DnaK suppressor protein